MVSTAAFHARVWGSVPGLGGFKEIKMFLPHPRVKVSIVGSLHDREVACSALARRARMSNPVSGGQCHLTILRRLSWPSLALYVHKGGLKPDSFHLRHFMKVICPWKFCVTRVWASSSGVGTI